MIVGAATLVLSTVAHLFTSAAVGVIALVAGGISFGIVIGTRMISSR